jgi:hypothetical protein
MKAHITVTDARGVVFEGAAVLVPARRAGSEQKTKVTKLVSKGSGRALSFTLNPRAFMNKHAKDASGSRKFTLLLARLAGGKIGKEVSIEEITSSWNRMKGILGPYNPAHATRAKENGWVDSPRKGTYVLAEHWKETNNSE